MRRRISTKLAFATLGPDKVDLDNKKRSARGIQPLRLSESKITKYQKVSCIPCELKLRGGRYVRTEFGGSYV